MGLVKPRKDMSAEMDSTWLTITKDRTSQEPAGNAGGATASGSSDMGPRPGRARARAGGAGDEGTLRGCGSRGVLSVVLGTSRCVYRCCR